MRNIAQWVHPMKDRSGDPSHHERTLLPWNYISLHGSGQGCFMTNEQLHDLFQMLLWSPVGFYLVVYTLYVTKHILIIVINWLTCVNNANMCWKFNIRTKYNQSMSTSKPCMLNIIFTIMLLLINTKCGFFLSHIK